MVLLVRFHPEVPFLRSDSLNSFAFATKALKASVLALMAKTIPFSHSPFCLLFTVVSLYMKRAEIDLREEVKRLCIIPNRIIDECSRVLNKSILKPRIKLVVRHTRTLSIACRNRVVSWQKGEANNISRLSIKSSRFKLVVSANFDLVGWLCVGCSSGCGSSLDTADAGVDDGLDDLFTSDGLGFSNEDLSGEGDIWGSGVNSSSVLVVAVGINAELSFRSDLRLVASGFGLGG